MRVSHIYYVVEDREIGLLDIEIEIGGGVADDHDAGGSHVPVESVRRPSVLGALRHTHRTTTANRFR